MKYYIILTSLLALTLFMAAFVGESERALVDYWKRAYAKHVADDLFSYRCVKDEITVGATDRYRQDGTPRLATNGGFNVCNPQHFRKISNCVIYSIGIRRNATFERALKERFADKCKFRVYQTQLQFNPAEEDTGLDDVLPLNISAERRQNYTTLSELFQQNGDPLQIPLLKMDVGENAIEMLTSRLSSVQACQILVTIRATPRQLHESRHRMMLSGKHLVSVQLRNAIPLTKAKLLRLKPRFFVQ